MENYKEMYFQLFNEVTYAIDMLNNNTDNSLVIEKLKEAQKKTEEMYINA